MVRPAASRGRSPRNSASASGVETGGRLVQNDNFGARKERSRKTKTPRLTGGQGPPGFSDNGIEGGGQRSHKAGEPDGAEDIPELVVDGVRLRQREVGADRIEEHWRVLHHQRDVRVQVFRADRANVAAIDGDVPGLGFEQAQHQLGNGGFAGAAGTDDGNALSGRDGQGEIVNDPAAGVRSQSSHGGNRSARQGAGKGTPAWR